MAEKLVLPNPIFNGNEGHWLFLTGKPEKVTSGKELLEQVGNNREQFAISAELKTLVRFLIQSYQEPANDSAIFTAEHKANHLHQLLKNLLNQDVKTFGADTTFQVWQVSANGQEAHWENWYNLVRETEKTGRLLNHQEICQLYDQLTRSLVHPQTPDKKIHICWEVAASLQNGQKTTFSEKLFITAKPIPPEIFDYYFNQVITPHKGEASLTNLPLLYKMNTRIPLIEILTQFNLIEEVRVSTQQQTQDLHTGQRRKLKQRHLLEPNQETAQALVADVIGSVPQAIFALTQS